ncbi:RPGR [Bugula neritina]|uniref:RPGR n=1 Tax=Bugula neritina TaxID=10212 RepID=A0A7J7JIU3_BUGNE|nr:RPGR [Bugula neritina]
MMKPFFNQNLPLCTIENGLVYVWGDNSEGQLGLGDGVSEAELPEQLRLDEKAVHISCGYYHTAVVTVSGALYTFGEEEGGKLGHGEGVIASDPLQVDIPDKVVWVSCGGRHTVAVTARGAVYSFGDGSDGQLGLGTNTMDTSKPTLVTYLKDIRIKRSSCGENFTAVISEKGQLYTFGNGRHGKLALGAENFTNQFRPFRVPRFAKFSVTKVSCGGCHTIALAHKKDLDDDGEDEEIHDPLNSTFANSLRLSTDLDSSISARDRRRSKDLPEARNRTLPPLTASSRSSTLPPLTSTLPSLDGAKMPTSLDKRKLPNAKFTQGDKEEDSEDSDVSVTPEGSSEEEENETVQRSMSNKREAMKKQSSSLANGKGKPTLKSKQLPKPNSKVQKEDTADEDSEVDSEEETQYRHKKRGDKTSKKVSKKELDSEEEEETTTKRGKSVVAKNKKNQKQKSLSEEDSALEDSEEEESEEEKRHNSNKSSKNAVKKSSGKEKKRSSKISEEDEEDSEAEDRKQKGKEDVNHADESCHSADLYLLYFIDRKSKLSVFGKGKKQSQAKGKSRRSRKRLVKRRTKMKRKLGRETVKRVKSRAAITMLRMKNRRRNLEHASFYSWKHLSLRVHELQSSPYLCISSLTIL